MKTVFILGAGASRQAGGPLMSDFLDKAEELYRTSRGIGEAKEAFDDVFKSVSELQGIHAKAYLNLDNFETLFGAIELAKITGKLAQRTRESIAELRNSIVTLIVRTLENTIVFPVSKNHIYPPKPYNRLAEGIAQLGQAGIVTSSNIAFITFNYDVALDYALSHMGSLGGIDYCLEPPKSAKIALLKLHGSINWGVCRNCQKIVSLDFDQMKLPIFIESESWTFDLGTNIDRKQHCGDPLIRRPVIIPPTWNKTGYHEDLAQVWSRASSELASAENIFVVGYSLPETDSFFRYLFALGAESSTRIKRFWVFDPDWDGTVEPRFRTMIGRGIENRFKFINGVDGEFHRAIPAILDELKKV